MTEKLFAEWMARDMGDAFIENIVLEKNIDGTYSQGMTRIKFNAFCAGLRSLPLITGEPVACVTVEGGKCIATRSVDFRHVIDGEYRLYTHPQPLQPITAEMVTDEMVIEYTKATNDERISFHDEIASAVNAYLKLVNLPEWAKTSSYPGLDLS